MKVTVTRKRGGVVLDVRTIDVETSKVKVKARANKKDRKKIKDGESNKKSERLEQDEDTSRTFSE